MRKIEIGQRFKLASPPDTVWQALNAVTNPTDIRHLPILSLDDPKVARLISEQALANERLYRRAKDD